MIAWLKTYLPGILICVAITVAAMLVEQVEVAFAGVRYLEALVIAILLGVLVRTFWAPGAIWRPGINFSAKTLLEIAIVLLGASLSVGTVWALGPILLFGIVTIVVVAIASSYAICSAFGLPPRMCILIACGNSICGNSAIVAVAPIIGATSDEVASSIAFTAVLGVVVVLTLPLLVPILELSLTQYGVLAGLTVYAVPQVLAATLPVGMISTQLGTLVKLVRVLMLGPVVIGLSLAMGRDGASRPGFSLNRFVPWFIIGFLVLATLRSAGLIPDLILKAVLPTATILTVVSMAALGLGVDLKVLGRVGGRVTLAVTLSLLVLLAISLGLIRLLGVA